MLDTRTLRTLSAVLATEVSEVDIALHHMADGDAQPAIVALVESGGGLAAAEVIATQPSVVALALGGADLAADLNAALAGEPMLFARRRLPEG
jgi:citrate lyase beta subunit